MNTYSSYKDSGVEWIGEIPSGWDKTKIKYVGKYLNGYPFKPKHWGDSGRLIIRIQNLTKGNSVENFYEGDLEDRYIIRKGDLLFSWSTTLGLFEWKREEGLLNQHIFKVVLNDMYIKKFFIHLFDPVVSHLNKQSHGSTMTHLTKDSFGRVELPLPPTQEQQQISDYLDYKTSIIDILIEKTQQKIELLKEQRTSLINTTVTKGLNPNVEMKDSGVEWIGEIPSGWSVVSLKYLFKIIKRISGELGYDVLSVTQKGLKVKDLDNFQGQHSMDYSKYQLVYNGDFVMNHMDLLTGYVDLSNKTGVTSPDYRVFSRINHNTNNNYFLYIFQLSYTRRIFYKFGRGVSNLGRWRLPSVEWEYFKVPVPDTDTQPKTAIFWFNYIKR